MKIFTPLIEQGHEFPSRLLTLPVPIEMIHDEYTRPQVGAGERGEGQRLWRGGGQPGQGWMPARAPAPRERKGGSPSAAARPVAMPRGRGRPHRRAKGQARR